MEPQQQNENSISSSWVRHSSLIDSKSTTNTEDLMRISDSLCLHGTMYNVPSPSTKSIYHSSSSFIHSSHLLKAARKWWYDSNNNDDGIP